MALLFLTMAGTKKTDKREPTYKDWDKIRAMYMREDNLDTIIKAMPKVNLTKRKIVAKMNKDGITARRKSIRDTVLDSIQKDIETEKIETNNQCIHLFNTGAKVIDLLLAQYLEEAQDPEKVRGKGKATAYNLDMLMSGVTKVQKGLRVCYGMDENGKLYEKEPEVLVIDGLDVDKI